MVGAIIYFIGVLSTLIYGYQMFKGYVTVEIVSYVIILSLFSWLGLATLYFLRKS